MAIDVHSTPRIGYEPGRRATRSSGADDLDWLGLGRTLWRRKLFLLGFVVIVLGLTAAYVSRLPPAFEAEALVMLNERQAQVAPEIPEVLAGLPPNEEGLQGQLLLIKSRSMAERIVDQLNHHMQPEYNPALRPKSADFVAWFGRRLRPRRRWEGLVSERLRRSSFGCGSTAGLDELLLPRRIERADRILQGRHGALPSLSSWRRESTEVDPLPARPRNAVTRRGRELPDRSDARGRALEEGEVPDLGRAELDAARDVVAQPALGHRDRGVGLLVGLPQAQRHALPVAEVREAVPDEAGLVLERTEHPLAGDVGELLERAVLDLLRCDAYVLHICVLLRCFDRFGPVTDGANVSQIESGKSLGISSLRRDQRWNGIG